MRRVAEGRSRSGPSGRSRLLAVGAALAALACGSLAVPFGTGAGARAETPPEPAPPPPPIPAPRDVPYPGTLALDVDATDLDHAVVRVREEIPLPGPGPITLLYPKWLPGNHSPTGPIDKLAGLRVSVDGRPIPWRRDPADVYAFHVDPPAGAKALQVELQYLSPTSGREGRVSMTHEMLDLEWNTVLLYPAGWFSRDISIRPRVRLPEGFASASALTPLAGGGGGTEAGPGWTAFATTTLNTLVDSPLIAGRYFRRIDLPATGGAPVRLDVMADRPEALEATPAELEAHAELVRQAQKLFASHHYDHYDFLVWLSDRMGGEGLEHHQSSEDGTSLKYFTDPGKTLYGKDLLSHEYTHSWNGKFRRPADLWTPNFNTPMGDSLLWVYEGQTQYWGWVLGARSGLMSRQDALDSLALSAATYDQRVGRTWRPLQDTTLDPIIAMRRPLSWLSWQRSEDYYVEGQLVWLDADTLIRERSGGTKSLDDFAAAFFGVHDGSFVTDTYTFEDVVRALNAVLPYDWASFLRARLDGRGPGAPLDGLARGGWRLVYTDVESPFEKSVEGARQSLDLFFSIGLTLDKTGVATQVLWDGPAFRAGLAEGDQIVAVDGDAYDADLLKDAVRRTASAAPRPLELLIKDKNAFRTVRLEYRGGLRYPHLERVAAAPDRLSALLAPKR